MRVRSIGVSFFFAGYTFHSTCGPQKPSRHVPGLRSSCARLAVDRVGTGDAAALRSVDVVSVVAAVSTGINVVSLISVSQERGNPPFGARGWQGVHNLSGLPVEAQWFRQGLTTCSALSPLLLLRLPDRPVFQPP